MQKLISDLKSLEESKQLQKSKLHNLFLEFDQIKKKQSEILHPSNPKENLLLRIRPELFALVLEFLDLKTCFRFRLMSGRANICIMKQLHQKIKQLQDQSDNLEYQLNDLQNKYSQELINQDLLLIRQNAQNGLTQLNRADIEEIRIYSRPPQIVSKVISLVCILLDQNIKQNQENWSDCQKYLRDSNNLLNQLLQLEIEKISDSKLKLLQEIHNVQGQQVQNISKGCYGFYLFIKSIVEIRESKYYSYILVYHQYIIQNQKLNLEKSIKFNKSQIEKLQQISK